MSSKSQTTGDGLYKELSLVTIGISPIAVKKYFTLSTIPTKGTSSLNKC